MPNILDTVQDGKPVPKVIDFGIGKATRQGSVERAAFTQLGMLMGTPEYISPEQAEASGLEVDTTTDIYSLGVVLYELLTGVLPFDSETLGRAGYAEMHRIIREQDPPKPSLRVTALGATAADIARQHQTTTLGLGKQLRGDLNAIAMKAMEKDRTRRYASASESAADITRYLHGEPVVASAPGVLYRTRKFVRRHRLGVAAAAISIARLNARAGSATVPNLPGGWSHGVLANGFLETAPSSTTPLWWFTLVVVLRRTGTPCLSEMSKARRVSSSASWGVDGSNVGRWSIGPSQR